MTKSFLLAFIPIFVAVDPIGLLPIFVSLTSSMTRLEKLKVIVQSLITALALAIVFIYLGKAIFAFLKITVGDFMIAGGAILFCIAIMDIMNPGRKDGYVDKDMGIVPLGTPLIAGPAVLTTSLILVPEYGMSVTSLAIIANIALTGATFYFSGFFIRILGDKGTKAFSKLISLLLAAIAVMMIRKGILSIISS